MKFFKQLCIYLSRLITSPFGYEFFNPFEENGISDHSQYSDNFDHKESNTPKENKSFKSDYHFNTISILSSNENRRLDHEDVSIR